MELEVCGAAEFDEESNEHNPADYHSDLPPEFLRYRDEGCELGDSCLNCSFPRCVYDEPGGRQRLRKRIRDRGINHMFAKDGKGLKDLAAIFGISQRTVQRALKAAIRERKGEISGNE